VAHDHRSVEVESHPKIQEAIDQILQAVSQDKCRPCGCLHFTLSAIERMFPKGEIPAELNESVKAARRRLREIEYDCLECNSCYPAVAMDALKTIINEPE
jgi:hypothetical protein